MENTEPEQPIENQSNEHSTNDYQQPILAKPVLMQDKSNWVRKSLIMLCIYVFLFYTIFNMAPIYIAAILVVLMIHEMGHFFAMKAYKYSNVKLFVLPMLGAYVTGKKATISQKQMSVIILAGPLPGIIIGFCLLISTIYFPNERLQMLGTIFFTINLFNLLPFIPLDGGRLLETLFLNKNHIIRLVFTIISIMALLAFAFYARSIIFLIIPVSMVIDLIMEVKNQKIRDYLDQEKINYVIDYDDLPNKDYWTIRDGIILSFNKRYAAVQAGVHQYSIMEGGLVQHVVAVLKTPFIKDVNNFGKISIMLIYILFLIGLPISYFMLKH